MLMIPDEGATPSRAVVDTTATPNRVTGVLTTLDDFQCLSAMDVFGLCDEKYRGLVERFLQAELTVFNERGG
jgi:hypothetical protein